MFIIFLFLSILSLHVISFKVGSPSMMVYSKSQMKMQSNFADQNVNIAVKPIKVGYQGEPGAYSEKASRELLGSRIVTVNYPSFEDVFKAVARSEVDYAVVPIENSLGGSIHTNFDLLLRYDLSIIAEHEFKVEHSLLALPGTNKSDIKRVLSHPQALAQCDNYLTALGVIKEATYDTAGSAKMIRDQQLTDCAAIASDIAAETYGLEILDTNIEDHDVNFTRFLLLSRQSVNSLIPPTLAAKTSIVFVLPDSPGALYKALACFSLRDIDCCKIESRPTSVQLLQYLQMKTSFDSPAAPIIKLKNEEKANQDLPRFRYTFYLDFLASDLDDQSQNAIHHLREQSSFVRVLGSYPVGGRLVGPIKSLLDNIAKIPVAYDSPVLSNIQRKTQKSLKIGIIGFGKFGQFLAKTYVKNHEVYCLDKDDMSAAAKDIGCEYYPLYDITTFMKMNVDVILVSVSIISFEEVLRLFPKDAFKGKLVVDVLSVKLHAKSTMLNILPEECDILCTHPMFGPESGKYGWQGLPFLYDKIRITDTER